MTSKKTLFAALIAGSAIVLSANVSQAHLFGRGGSCGSGGGWGSRGSHGSWGGSYGSYGSSGSYGSYGSSGSYGSYGSYGGGSCGSCGSAGGSYGYYGGIDGGYASTRVVYSSVASATPSTPAVKTSLTIRVPADAKISLAGVETKQSGDVRQFATTRLAAGQTWDGYKVVVELNKDGQVLHEERTLRLVGGEAQELSINFDSKAVAKN